MQLRAETMDPSYSKPSQVATTRKSKEHPWKCKGNQKKTFGLASNIEAKPLEMQGTSKGHDDDDDDDDQWVRNRGTPTPLYECFIFSHYKLRWSSTMTTQDGHTLMSIDSENLPNRFKDIQKTRLITDLV